MKAEKISAEGQQPCPRYAHAACFIRDFLVIHGGRNDNIFSSLKNIGLNDMHLYDVNLNTWVSVCLFNQIPCSRWGHVICGGKQKNSDDYQGDTLIIFGGINLKS